MIVTASARPACNRATVLRSDARRLSSCVAAIAIGIAFIYWPAGVIVGGVLLALIGAIVWASGDEDDTERAWASKVEDKAED